MWWRLSTSLAIGISDYKSLFFRISAEAVGMIEVVEAVHLSGQDYLIIRVCSLGSLLRLLVWWRL